MSGEYPRHRDEIHDVRLAVQSENVYTALIACMERHLRGQLLTMRIDISRDHDEFEAFAAYMRRCMTGCRMKPADDFVLLGRLYVDHSYDGLTILLYLRALVSLWDGEADDGNDVRERIVMAWQTRNARSAFMSEQQLRNGWLAPGLGAGFFLDAGVHLLTGGPGMTLQRAIMRLSVSVRQGFVLARQGLKGLPKQAWKDYGIVAFVAQTVCVDIVNTVGGHWVQITVNVDGDYHNQIVCTAIGNFPLVVIDSVAPPPAEAVDFLERARDVFKGTARLSLSKNRRYRTKDAVVEQAMWQYLDQTMTANELQQCRGRFEGRDIRTMAQGGMPDGGGPIRMHHRFSRRGDPPYHVSGILESVENEEEQDAADFARVRKQEQDDLLTALSGMGVRDP